MYLCMHCTLPMKQQTATQFRNHVDAAVTNYSKEATSNETTNSNKSLMQKLTYLNALFAVVEQEQSALLLKLRQQYKGNTTTCDDKPYDLFWDDVMFAEGAIDPMTSPKRYQPAQEQESKKSSSSSSSTTTESQEATKSHGPNGVDDEYELVLTDAIEKCQLYVDQTKLLDSLVWKLHLARATTRIAKLSITKSTTTSTDRIVSHEPNATDSSPGEFANHGLADIDYCITHMDDGVSVSVVQNGSCTSGIQHDSTAQLHFLRAKALLALSTTNSNAMEEAKLSFAKAIVLDPSKREEWTSELGDGGHGILEGSSEG